MKTTTNYSSIILILILFLFTSCDKHESKDITQSKTDNKKAYLKTAGTCNCAPRESSSCFDDCIVKDLMNSQDSRNFIIRWESCDNDDLIDGKDCRDKGELNPGTGTNYQSFVKLCYMDRNSDNTNECSILMEIDQLPPCIKCISGFPRCIKFRAKCDVSTVGNQDGTHTQTTVLNLVADDPDVTGDSNVNWTVSVVTIQGDPKIKICCEKNVGGAIITYCCSGDLQPN